MNGSLHRAASGTRSHEASGWPSGRTARNRSCRRKRVSSPGRAGQPHEAAVYPALHDPFPDFGIVAQQQFEGDFRVVLAEGADKRRQPVGGDAGEGADADEAGLQAVDGIDFALQVPVGFADMPCVGEQPLAFRGEPESSPVAFEKGDVPFFFQIADHAADGGLGMEEFFAGPGEATGFHGGDEGLVFADVRVHGLSFPYGVFCMRFCYGLYDKYSLFVWQWVCQNGSVFYAGVLSAMVGGNAVCGFLRYPGGARRR